MMGEYRALGRAVFEKNVKLYVRYWINTVSGLIATYIMFVLVFFGGRAVAPDIFGDAVSAVIVGFFVWGMSFGAFQVPSQGLMGEAQWGTLEQLYMTPRGLGVILAFRMVVSLLLSFLFGIVLLGLMMVTAGRYLVVDPVTIVPIALLTICTAAGVGLAFGGLAILHKRVEGAFSIVRFLFLGAIFAPSDPYVFNLLPLTLGFDLLGKSMQEGLRIWELPVFDLVVLVLLAAAYLAAGGLVLRFAINRARARGIMSDY